MRHRSLALLSAAAVIGVTALVLNLGCNSTGRGQNAGTPARTPWGDPDLQGIWRDVNPVPLERPTQFGDRQFLTDEEVAARTQAAKAYDERVLAGEEMAVEGGQDAFDQTWFHIPGRSVSRRTSQIIDPPNGRLPPWTPQRLKRWEAREAATRARGLADSWEDRRLIERCINTAITLLDGARATAQAAREIVQAPGYVAMAIETQNGYDYRIVPLDGRPRLGSRIRLWTGDARGRWEGDTLVVEITNLIDKLDGGAIVPASGALGEIYAGSGETLRIIERYRRMSPDTLEYQYTIDDPQTYTRPYTAMRELSREDQYQMYSPSACHEANEGLAGQLASARADEKASLEAAARLAGLRQKRLEEIKAASAAADKAGY